MDLTRLSSLSPPSPICSKSYPVGSPSPDVEKEIEKGAKMERIDLSHALNAPYRTSSNPNLTPPPRPSTLPSTTPSLTPDLKDGLGRYPYSAEGEAGSSTGSPLRKADLLTSQLLGSSSGTASEGAVKDENGFVDRNIEPSSTKRRTPLEDVKEGEESESEDDMDILDVSNTQWDAVLQSKRSRDSGKGSSRKGHSDAITEQSMVSQLERDKRRFEEEDAYWADVQRQRSDPRKAQLGKPPSTPPGKHILRIATLSAKRKRASSRARSLASSPAPKGDNRTSNSSDSASPMPWSPSPPRCSASSRTSLHCSSSPKRQIADDEEGEAKLGDLFNTPPQANTKIRREPLRQIHLSDSEGEEDRFDNTRRSVDKGKSKAPPSREIEIAHTHGGRMEEEEQEIPEDLAWMEAQADRGDEFEEDEFGVDEAELALFDAPRPAAISSSSRKRRRPTPTFIEDDDNDDNPVPLYTSSSSRPTTRGSQPLRSLSNLPLPLPLIGGTYAVDQPNVAGVHFSPLSASLGLSHPLMFVSDLSEELQDFYRNHGKGAPRGATSDKTGAGSKTKTGKGKGRARIEVIEEEIQDEYDFEGGEGGEGAGQRSTGGRGARGRGRGGKKWGGWRGRGGFRGRGKGRGRAKTSKT